MVEQKKRRLISYEKLPKEVVEVFRSKYPQGIDDVDESDILTVDTPKGETFQAVRLETDDAIYLIKVKTIEKSFVAIDDEDELIVPEVPPAPEIKEELPVEDDEDEDPEQQ